MKERSTMTKIGRNEPCPCGSGKKYKNCCLGEPEETLLLNRLRINLAKMWSYDKVNEMSDSEIISKLENLNIPFDKERFLADIQVFDSANELSEQWFDSYDVRAEGYDEDFLFFAAWILWERWAKEGPWPFETIGDWFDKGVLAEGEGNFAEACDAWLIAWDALKPHHPTTTKYLTYLDDRCSGEFSVKSILLSLGSDLLDAGMKDPSYLRKAITYCTEFLALFSDEDENTLINQRRTIADAYLYLDDLSRAEAEYKSIVQDYPMNVWGYVGWGDMYFLHEPTEDLNKATQIYARGLAKIALGAEDRDVLEDRLDDVQDNDSE
jgi:tetratricopeptide (TPR) repeat protein